MNATAPVPTGDQLVELVAENLGVIERLGLVFAPGMTAITGETGAGKTLLLTALDLLIGGRADTAMVGPHGDEAVVEGRFVRGGEELVIQRVVPRSGRSRAYVDGRLANASTLAELGGGLVEVNGQHAHTALVAPAAQRAALDRFAAVDLSTLAERRARLRVLRRRLDELGGDDRERLREQELYRFQIDEIDDVGIVDVDEDDELRAQELVLAHATEHRDAAASVADAFGSDGSVAEGIGRVLGVLHGSEPMADLAGRAEDLLAEVTDIAQEARRRGEAFEADPERLAQLQERRRRLSELRRKYGDTLADVVEYRDELQRRLDELVGHDELAARLEADIGDAEAAVAEAEAAVGAARRAGAPELGRRVSANLRELALATARLECHVGAADPGDDVTFMVAMNAGMPLQPMAKVASGGELARTMLAVRLVLSADPATIVFDEVDAGVGGAAALSVGQALGRLGRERQVLVVTHLAQVAAHADNQVSVVKSDDGSMVSVTATDLDPGARVIELSRMLSGSPGSDVARSHAEELLRTAQEVRRATSPAR